jgi:hypothetical protein
LDETKLRKLGLPPHCCFLWPRSTAYVATFLVQYVAAAMLGADGFGLFYLATTLGNVLFSGSFVLNIYFTRYLSKIAREAGPLAIFPTMRRVERAVLSWGLAGSVGALLILVVVGQQVGVTSRLLILLIVLDVYTAYVADLGRVLLQAQRQTVALGLYTLGWMVLRLLFCVLGIVMFRTVWGAMIGICASNVSVSTLFHAFLARVTVGAPRANPLPSVVTLLPVLSVFGLLAAVYNMDVILGYLSLTEGNLAIYSASSVYPKAILAATLPLLQMLFAIISGDHPSKSGARIIAGKTALLVFALAVGGAGIVWLASDRLCGGQWGLQLCQTSPLRILLFSAIPLSLIRVLVLFQIADGRDWLGLWLAIPVVLFLVIGWSFDNSVASLANGFALFSLATLFFFGGSTLIADMALRHRKRAAGR